MQQIYNLIHHDAKKRLKDMSLIKYFYFIYPLLMDTLNDSLKNSNETS